MQRLYLPLTLKDLVYVVILTAVFTFFSFILYVRVEPTQIEGIYVFLYGLPFPWLRTEAHVSIWFVSESQILWAALVSDIILYFLLSLTLVLTISWLATKFRKAEKH